MKPPFSFIPLVMFLLLAQITAAQKIITLPKKSEDFAKRKVHISKVIDDRLYQASIGDVYVSIVNIPQPAQFELPFTEALFKFYAKHFPPKPTTSPMVMIVKELKVEEIITLGRETGIARVRILLAEEDSNGLLLVKHAYKELVEGDGVDVTLGHGKRIAELLRNVLTTQAYSIPIVPYHYRLIYHTPFEPTVWTQNLRQGLYATFEDLYTNHVIPFSGKVTERESDMLLHDLQGNRVIDKFAFYEGNRLFINAQAYTSEKRKSFEPVLELGRFLYFEDKMYNPVQLGFGATFGMAGVFIAAGTAPDCGVVDMGTGKIIGLNDEAFHFLLDPYPDLLSKYEASTKTKDIKRTIIKELNVRMSTSKE